MPTPDRLPPIPEELLTDAQRRAAAELTAGPRGALSGPFVPLLRSPGLLSRMQALGAYLRFESPLPARLRELAILVTARRYTQQFEWHTHRPLAEAAGLAPASLERLAVGRRPGGLAPDEAAVHDLCDELHRTQAVGDATWARAVERLGEEGVVEVLGTCGYYTALAMVMNAACTPLPDGVEPPLGPAGASPEPIGRGDLFWIEPDGGRGPVTEHPHPHVVVQDDVLNNSRIDTVVVCALTSNLHRAKEPGNVLLEPGEGRLPRQSVVVVSQVSTVEKARLGARVGSLSAARVEEVLAGLRFLQASFLGPR